MRMFAGVMIALLVALPSYASKYFMDGNRLVDLWRGAQRMEASAKGEDQTASPNPVYDSMQMAEYIGFVVGVVDGMGIANRFPEQTSAAQMTAIVGKWLEDNPEQWHQPGYQIVATALSEWIAELDHEP